MAEITGEPTFQNHLRRLETTDPRHPDTWNPNNAVLLNNTVYLKKAADELAGEIGDAKGDAGTLADRLAAMDNSIVAAGPANIGEISIVNRGVISGCVISRSSTATRNLHVSSGICFANGRSYAVGAANNAASVPQNTSPTDSVVVSAYLQYSGVVGAYVLATTTVGGAVPADAIEIYRLTIPANNTDATDPHLDNVSLTDVRRLEPLFPCAVSSPVNTYIPIADVPDSVVMVDVDVVSATGRCDKDMVIPNSRATNGFSLRLEAAADNVIVRYRVNRLLAA